MFSVLFAFLFAASAPVNLYITQPISEKDIHKALAQGYWITDYVGDCAISLAPAGKPVPPSAQLIASNLDEDSLWLVQPMSERVSLPSLNAFDSVPDAVYQSERFWIIRGAPISREQLDELKLYALPLSAKCLIQPRPTDIPTQPADLPEAREAMTMLTADQLMSYDQSLADFISRYTFDARFVDAQEWSDSVFPLLCGKLSHQSYSITDNYYSLPFTALKTDEELIVQNGSVYRKTTTGCEQYNTGMNVTNGYFSPDGNYTYICGFNGYVGWNTQPKDYSDWTVIQTGYAVNLNAIYTESNKIWAVGDAGTLLYSPDRGSNWQKIDLGLSTISHLLDIGKFKTGADGNYKYFISGKTGVVLNSDNGINWTRLITPGGSGWFSSICGFYNPTSNCNEVMITGFGDVIITPDGGTTWRSATTSSYEWKDSAYNAGRLWVVGCTAWHAYVAVSDDYGNSWNNQLNANSKEAYRISLPSEATNNRAYICGLKCYMKTDDGGISWQDMESPKNTYQNCVFEISGTRSPDEFVIICAHEDSYSNVPYIACPGADDNGSGSAAVLALSKVMSKWNFDKTVRFVLFSGEEQGMKGSESYAEQCVAEGENIVAVLNMDMIGYNHQSVSDFIVWYYLTGSELSDFIISCNGVYSPGILLSQEEDPRSDHHYFGSNGYQAVTFIEPVPEDYPYLHTQFDLPSALDPEYFLSGAQLMLATAMELAVPNGLRYIPEPAPPVHPADPYIYPNPLRPNAGTRDFFLIVNLQAGDRVTVCDLSGEQVLQETAATPSITWAPQVASGIYFYTIKTAHGVFKGKLAVIK